MASSSIVTRASAALDKSVVRFMERRMAPRAPAAPLRSAPHDSRRQLLEVAAIYNAGTHALPSRFFPEPPVPVPTLTPVGDGPLGTRVADLAFESSYEPFHAAARALHDGVRENHTAHARWWTSGHGRPTIVLLHGWGGGQHWITQRSFGVPYWLRHGFDVAAVVLPYHGLRSPSGTLLWPSPDPLRTNEGFGQAIFELRALARYFRTRGASAVGAIGMSLGGYTTATWASVAGPRDVGGLDFAVAMIPAVSMAHLMWHHGEQSVMRRRAMGAGITEDLLVDAFAVHAPTTRPVRVPSSHLAIIAGHGDRITPPDQAETLAAHWGVGISWFEGGHLAPIGRADAIRTVRRQLGGLGFSGREMRL